MVILETERLFLRTHQDDDLFSLHDIFSDPETMTYYSEPFSIEKTQNWINKNQNRCEADGFGLWAVCLKATNELIGDCGLVRQQVTGKTEVEVGYHINKNYWSNGYATEAALACIEYGFAQLGLNKLISIIDAEKNGFVKGKTAFFCKYHLIYECRSN